MLTDELRPTQSPNVSPSSRASALCEGRLLPQQGGQRRKNVRLLHVAGDDRSQIPEPEQGRTENDPLPMNDDARTLHIQLIGASGESPAASKRRSARKCRPNGLQALGLGLHQAQSPIHSQSRFSVTLVPSFRNESASSAMRDFALSSFQVPSVMFRRSMYHGSLTGSLT